MKLLVFILTLLALGCSEKPRANSVANTPATRSETPLDINSESAILALRAMDKGWRIHSISYPHEEVDSVTLKYIEEFKLLHRLDLDSNNTYTNWEPHFQYTGKWHYDDARKQLYLMNTQGIPRDTFQIVRFTPDTLTVNVLVGDNATRKIEHRIYVPI